MARIRVIVFLRSPKTRKRDRGEEEEKRLCTGGRESKWGHAHPRSRYKTIFDYTHLSGFWSDQTDMVVLSDKHGWKGSWLSAFLSASPPLAHTHFPLTPLSNSPNPLSLTPSISSFMNFDPLCRLISYPFCFVQLQRSLLYVQSNLAPRFFSCNPSSKDSSTQDWLSSLLDPSSVSWELIPASYCLEQEDQENVLLMMLV